MLLERAPSLVEGGKKPLFEEFYRVKLVFF
jgi:hypothetical protein